MNQTNLTKTQEQFWILQKMFPGNTAYNIRNIFRIEGTPEIGFLNQALQQVVSRHGILRARIFEDGNQLFQEANYQVSEFVVEVVNCIETPKNDIPDEILTEIHHPFNLEKDPLLRTKLFIFPNGISYLTFVFHHIVTDLRSKEIFAEEFSAFYNSLVEGTHINLDEPGFSYFDFASHQKSWLESSEAKQMLANWKNELDGLAKPESLPSDFDEIHSSTLNGVRMNFEIGADLSERIKHFSRENTISPFVALLSAFAVFTGRLSNTEELTIGVPLSNRRMQGSENCFGCFMNIVPIKINFNGDLNSVELARQIRQKMMFAHRNQELPLLSLTHEINNRAESGINQLFRVGFTFEPPMELPLRDLKIEPILAERQGAQLDLFLIFYERNGKFYGTFEYSTDLYSRQTISRWKEVFIKVVESMMTQPEKSVLKINILPENEWNLIKKWNDTDCEFENNLCIHKKFELQVDAAPDDIALLFYDQKLTYHELNLRANQLAHFLIEKGVRIEDKIGICIKRSFEMVVAVLATLKAGAVYVPLDTDSPSERIKSITEDACVKFILTTFDSAKNLEVNTKNIFLDQIIHNNGSKISNPEVKVEANNLAYMIYTSGSTGKPKGVMVEHRSVMNKIGWIQKQFPLQKGESMLQKITITFDVSVWELFWWMFSGGKLDILKPGGEKDPKAIVERLWVQKPAVLIFVPSVFSLFIDYLVASRQEKCFIGVRWIILIGEALSPTLVNRFNKMYQGTEGPVLINTYGPTEATVAVSWFECSRMTDFKKIFIGKPIANTKLFVVNKYDQVQPFGIAGELVIAGVNLARGYHGTSELTNRKFTNISLPDESNMRAYKTGDLAKWDISGEIDFIGRFDNQIKIHGIRVELGDIESKILEHPGISETAVITIQGNNEIKSIAGYVVPKSGYSGVTREISIFLQKKIPTYMIPSVWVELEKMPLTTSGKINRKMLPLPIIKSSSQFLAPTKEYERILAKIWIEILNLDQVGINDNFFESGGDSMKAVILATKIQQNLKIEVDVIKVMEYPNIKALAAYLGQLQKTREPFTPGVNERATLRKNNRPLRRLRDTL